MTNEETGEEQDHYYCFTSHYLNEAQVRDERNKHYLDWVEKGHLVETPGNVTDYVRVVDDLARDANELMLRELAFDPFHAEPLVQFLQARGDWNQSVECMGIRQTWENLSPPMKEFEALISARRFHHDGNPVLAWMIGNTRCKIGRSDDWYPERKNVTRKIDGTIAILLALNRLMKIEADSYTEPRIRWI